MSYLDEIKKAMTTQSLNVRGVMEKKTNDQLQAEIERLEEEFKQGYINQRDYALKKANLMRQMT